MGHFKTFVLGLLTAYGVYYITRKNANGRSILDDLVDNPEPFLKNAQSAALEGAANADSKVIH